TGHGRRALSAIRTPTPPGRYSQFRRGADVAGANQDYRYVPIATPMDLTGLNDLRPAEVTVGWQSEQADAEQVERVVARNPSSNLAFFVHLTVRKGKGGEDIAPVYWSDNYFELLP